MNTMRGNLHSIKSQKHTFSNLIKIDCHDFAYAKSRNDGKSCYIEALQKLK
ncbi:hypothetical protein [Helicobacter sp. T3_23-1056]